MTITNVLLGVLLLCAHNAASISAPNCTVQAAAGMPCIGHDIGTFEQGETIPEILQNLHNRFCGCTHITGSILINLEGPDIGRELTEDDFNFLYHVEQISNALRFTSFPQTSRIILPNLRIIRGEDLIADRFALVVQDTNISDLILPKLTQITRGNARFENTGTLCNHRTINWIDILDCPIGGVVGLETVNSCEPDNTELIFGLPNCAMFCDSPLCWSPDYCQTLTKTVCQSCLLDRCYNVDDFGTKQCCNPHCAAGCQGPTADQCNACKDLENNGTCVIQCPPPIIYDPNLFQLVPNPDRRLAAGDSCVEECPSGFFELSGSCVLQCPSGYAVGEDGRVCQFCDGPCPKECAGISATDIIDASNIERFQDCTIITSGGIFIGLVPTGPQGAFDYFQLELLSTIVEIRGPLKIQGFPGTSFPYLRNLRFVGSANATVEVTASCGGVISYSVIVSGNPDLMEIDLSALEEIRGRGVIWASNPELCFTGDFSSYVSSDSGLTGIELECAFQNRRDPAACVADGFICHEQCNSNSSCWGRGDHQCDGCRNFRYRNRCVEDCFVISSQLPLNSSELFQNEQMKVCEDCDPECVGGCNGTGPQHCFQCRTYFVESRNEDGMRVQLCVPECPFGTYLNASLSQCILCHENCTAGCVGPLPYLDLTKGCLDCSLVLLDRDGRQERCLRDRCHSGTYGTQLSPEEHSTALTGDLQFGSEICKPCNELCAECTGEGTSRAVCPLCKIATSAELQECVSACDEYREYLDPGSIFCQSCSISCQGCTGPAATDCLECASSFVKKFTGDGQNRFSCITSCDLGEYPEAETRVCTNCDPLCDFCVGPGSTNCTSCSNIRFQIELEEVGPENETLYECFGCLNTERLVNRTCVRAPEFGISNVVLRVIVGAVGALLLLVVVSLIICIMVGMLSLRLHRKKKAELKIVQLENLNLSTCVHELVTIPTESATNQAYGVTSDIFSRTQDEPLYSTIEETANGGVSESNHVSRPGDVDYSCSKLDKLSHNATNIPDENNDIEIELQ